MLLFYFNLFDMPSSLVYAWIFVFQLIFKCKLKAIVKYRTFDDSLSSNTSKVKCSHYVGILLVNIWELFVFLANYFTK